MECTRSSSNGRRVVRVLFCVHRMVGISELRVEKSLAKCPGSIAMAKRLWRFSPWMHVGTLRSRWSAWTADHAAYAESMVSLTLVLKRLSHRHVIRSGRVPVRPCRCHHDGHGVHVHASGPRTRSTVPTTAPAQTARRTLGRYRPSWSQARDAWVGVRPVVPAPSWAVRRRGATPSSGRREALRRPGRGASWPPETSRSTTAWQGTGRWRDATRGRDAAASLAARHPCPPVHHRRRPYACWAAICRRAVRQTEPPARPTQSCARRGGTSAAARAGSAAVPSVRGRSWIPACVSSAIRALCTVEGRARPPDP